MRDLAAGLVACIQRQVPKAADISAAELLTTERMKEFNITDSFVNTGQFAPGFTSCRGCWWSCASMGAEEFEYLRGSESPLTVTRAVAEEALQGLDDEDKQYALNIIAYLDLDKKKGFRQAKLMCFCISESAHSDQRTFFKLEFGCFSFRY